MPHRDMVVRQHAQDCGSAFRRRIGVRVSPSPPIAITIMPLWAFSSLLLLRRRVLG